MHQGFVLGIVDGLALGIHDDLAFGIHDGVALGTLDGWSKILTIFKTAFTSFENPLKISVTTVLTKSAIGWIPEI